MNIQPLQDRVLVKPLHQEEVKKGGIIIPDTAKEKPQEGEIVASPERGRFRRRRPLGRVDFKGQRRGGAILYRPHRRSRGPHRPNRARSNPDLPGGESF